MDQYNSEITSAQTKSTGISSLYVLKTLCVFFVVVLHAPMEGTSFVFLDVGVPCFFIISGYFLYNPDLTKVTQRVMKVAYKALCLLLFLTAIYVLLGPPEGLPTTIPMVARWLFVSIPSRYGGHLWYLVSLFWGLLAFRFYLWIFKGKGIHWLIIPAFFGLFIGRYRFLLDGSTASIFVLNFISYALPCLAIGYLARKWETVLKKYRAIDFAVVISICAYMETVFVHFLSNGLPPMGPLLLTYPTAFAWFWVALQYKDFGKDSFIETVGREHSARIYYWHPLFVWAFTVLDKNNISFGFQSFGAIYVFLATLILSILIGLVSPYISRLIKKK